MREIPKEVKKLHQRQLVLFLLVLTFATVVLWISLSIFRTSERSQIDKDLLTLAEPIESSIDQRVFPVLQNKRHFSDAELDSFPIFTLYQAGQGQQEKQIVTLEEYRQLKTSNSPQPLPQPEQPTEPLPQTIPLNDQPLKIEPE